VLPDAAAPRAMSAWTSAHSGTAIAALVLSHAATAAALL
jgi:hypothetical protein